MSCKFDEYYKIGSFVLLFVILCNDGILGMRFAANSPLNSQQHHRISVACSHRSGFVVVIRVWFIIRD